MIEAINLSKRYGDALAVDNLSFTIKPGKVTGFLGPNGAGKSTTMRLLLGLDRPESGEATIAGKRYADLARPMLVVGALLEARAVHSGRSAFNHLLCLAQTQGVSRQRIDEVLNLVGLEDVARKRAGTFSLGMGQRLGIAAALLGDPPVLILDEPLNGLDPEGILWIRTMMKQFAAEGRTVFVSSHLMNEMAVTAEHLIVVGRGKLVADCSTEEFIERNGESTVLVRSPDATELGAAITREGGTVTSAGSDQLTVANMDASRIGKIAAANSYVLHEVVRQQRSLEEAFMDLTREKVVHKGSLAKDHGGAA